MEQQDKTFTKWSSGSLLHQVDLDDTESGLDEQLAESDLLLSCEEIELPFATYTIDNKGLQLLQNSQEDQQCEFSLVKPVRLSNENQQNFSHQFPSTVLLSPLQKKYMTSSRQKTERTPKTILRMMERHRENERVRHHTLNKSMKVVCNRVPGLTSYLKETKVVMMQRIIAYICYLENTMCNLCESLVIKIPQLKLQSNLLIDQWRDPSAKLKSTGITSYFRPYKKRFNYMKKRLEYGEKNRLKVSSPTVDSTTDNNILPTEGESDSDQAPVVPTPSQTRHHNQDIDGLLDTNACSVPSSMEDTPDYFNEDFLPSSSSFDNFPDAFDLVSSPISRAVKSRYVLLSPKVKSMDNVNTGEFGIKSDEGDFMDIVDYVNSHEMRTISPECVLPTTPLPCSTTSCLVGKIEQQQLQSARVNQFANNSQPSSVESEPLLMTPDRNTLLKNKNKRKQYTPKRSPFSNITNFEKTSEPSHKRVKTAPQPARIIKPNSIDEDFVSYVPYIWKFHNMAITRRQKTAKQEAEAAKHKKVQESYRKPEKIDHRKTTWMNGFMMFSRLNRREFIEANPGVHTSHISKMMGHAWRNMTADDQLPYKEKAREFAKCMKSNIESEAMQAEVAEPVEMVTSSGILNHDEDSVDAVLHQHMVPFKITS